MSGYIHRRFGFFLARGHISLKVPITKIRVSAPAPYKKTSSQKHKKLKECNCFCGLLSFERNLGSGRTGKVIFVFPKSRQRISGLGIFGTLYQDAFDHDKGQKSAISGRDCLNFLQWIFSFSPGFSAYHSPPF